MPLGEYVTGALFYLPTLGSALAAAYVVLRRRYGYLPVLQKWLAYLVLATTAIVLACVLPAALAILSRPTMLVASVALLAASLAIPASGARPSAEPEPLPPSSRVSIAIAALTVGAALIYELGRLRLLATAPITETDMLSFHLPGIARFIQTGTLWRVDQFLPGFATAQYPNDGDFLLLSAVLPWHDLAFVRFVPLPFFAFTGIGTYALALELRAPRAAAATMAAAVVTVPAVSLLALDGLPDAVSLATLAAGLVFLLRHARHGGRDELVLAGLAFGISLGTKWYGATSVAIIAIVWIAVGLLVRRRLRKVLADAGVLIAAILSTGGIWLIRNLVESGNPIYPKAVSVLGLHLFPGSRGDVIDTYGYTVANYLGNFHVLRTYVYPAFKSELGLTGLVLALAVLIAAAAAVRAARRDARARLEMAVVLGLALVVVGICADYVITPGSAYGLKDLPVQTFANVRWLMPAIMIAAALAARVALLLGRVGVVLELAGLAGAIDGIHLGPRVPGGTYLEVGLVAAALVAAALLVRRWTRTNRSQLSGVRTAVLAAAGVALVALLALARLDQHRFDEHSYAGYDPTIAWIESRAPSGHRIGIAGAWSTTGLIPTLPAFGPRLGNYVAYVGDPVRHSLHFPATRSSFDGEVRRGRYDLLLIGLQEPAHTDVWARTLGYRLVAQSPRLALYAAPRGS